MLLSKRLNALSVFARYTFNGRPSRRMEDELPLCKGWLNHYFGYVPKRFYYRKVEEAV